MAIEGRFYVTLQADFGRITVFSYAISPLGGVTTTDEDIDVIPARSWLAFPINYVLNCLYNRDVNRKEHLHNEHD